MTRLTVISLGAGVQSTTMALMAAHGEITPMPDCAIFADTQDEPAAVYRHLDWLMSPDVLPFPVHVVTLGRLSDALFAGKDRGRIPFHFHNGLGRRRCTQDFKLRPIRSKLRTMLGSGRPRPSAVEMWIGISMDEAFRMKPAKVAYVANRWPLIEQKINRRDCLSWLRRHGYPQPPKSACVYCPYRDTAQWRAMKADSPDDWQQAIAVDERLRSPEMVAIFKGEQFIHHSCKPLAKIDFSTPEDRGQLNLFLNECEGMCGV